MERHIFDENQPQGTISLQNLRNALRGLFQGDLMPMRPRASRILDDMEYSTDTLAAAAFAGTGVTVTKTTTKHDGNYALQCAIDGTDNRRVTKSQNLVLSGFVSLTLWERENVGSSAFQFFLSDGVNESYWDLTADGTPDTWKQHTLTLASPDSDSGTPADLSAITSWGFLLLDASTTYIFDQVIAICALCVFVEPAVIASYYAQMYVGTTHLSFAGGASPTLTPPAANPRIDVLTIDSSGTLAWTAGTEAASPVAPTYPTGKIPICEVYCKTTMAKVVNYEDAAANPNEAYIYRDVRPLILLASSSFISLTDCPASYSGKGNYRVHVNSGETALEFILDKFINLVDCPSAYTGKSGYFPIVNTGETALVFKQPNIASGPVVLDATAKIPALNGSQLTNLPAQAGTIVQVVNSQTGAYISCPTAIPDDDTIPTSSEGDEVMTLAITPTSAANLLKIDVVIFGCTAVGSFIRACLFQDSGGAAIAVGAQGTNNGNFYQCIAFTYFMTAGTVASTTFKTRLGATGSGAYFNGNSSGRGYGGVLMSSITITEIKV